MYLRQCTYAPHDVLRQCTYDNALHGPHYIIVERFSKALPTVPFAGSSGRPMSEGMLHIACYAKVVEFWARTTVRCVTMYLAHNVLTRMYLRGCTYEDVLTQGCTYVRMYLRGCTYEDVLT